MRIARWVRVAAHGVSAAFILRVLYPGSSSATQRRLLKWWSVRLLRILNVTPLVEGEPPGSARCAAMIAANHVSWLDIFVVSSVHPSRFIAKSEIRGWPLVGWIVENAGTLFVNRGRRDLAFVTQRVQAALAQGDCIGLFPEGTTTEGDKLLKFHSALFEPAMADGARIHPVAIRYQYADGTLCRAASFVGEISFMQSLGLIVRQRRIVARIAFSEPIETAGVGRREMARIVEDRVATLLGLIPQDSGPGTPHGRPGESP